MGGKVLAGLVAIAISSASVGGVVSSGAESLRPDDVGAIWPFEASGAVAPAARVVIDTANTHLMSIPDPPEHVGARCEDAAGAGRCVLLPQAPGVTLTIFGHTVSLPTD